LFISNIDVYTRNIPETIRDKKNCMYTAVIEIKCVALKLCLFYALNKKGLGSGSM